MARCTQLDPRRELQVAENTRVAPGTAHVMRDVMFMRRLRQLVLLPLLVLAACDGAVESSGPAPVDPGAGALSPEARGVFEAINEERTRRGLEPVTLRDDLVCSAAKHSEDIGERQACSHDGADGGGPGDRVESCGGSGWSGEIVACGQTTPREAVDGWLDSPGHKAIMLDPDQRRVGVGMHNHYWTAIFHKSE